MIRQSKSTIWRYFKPCIGPDNDNKAECLLCNENSTERFLVRGSARKTFSTTPLWNHLKKRHPDAYKEYQDSYPDPSPSQSRQQIKTQRHFKFLSHLASQISTLDRRKIWDLNDPKSQALTTKICEMMALDAEPLTLVEQEGFQRLIKHLAPRYLWPSTTYFSETAMPQLYEDLKAQVKGRLASATYVTFTTDIWRSTSTFRESIMSLTVHFIPPDRLQREAYTLGTKVFHEPPTRENITDIINITVEEWELQPSQLHLIVLMDRSEENVVVGKDLKVTEGVACFIHNLQIVIHEVIFARRAITDVIALCKEITMYIKHSSSACIHPETIREMHLRQETLEFVDWRSAYYILVPIHEQRQVLIAYAAKNNIPTLSPDQWILLEKLIFLLKPFEEITKQTIANQEVISFVIPAVAALHSYLSKRKQNDEMQPLKDELRRALEKRFLDTKEMNINGRKSFVIATVLDPRFKTSFLRDEATAMKWIINELIAENWHYRESSKEHLLETLETKEDNNLKTDKYEDIWGCFHEIAKSSPYSNLNRNLRIEGITVDDSRNIAKAEHDITYDDCREIIKIEHDIIDVDYRAMKSEDIVIETDYNSSQSQVQSYTNHYANMKSAICTTELMKYLSLPLLPRTEDPLQWWRQNRKGFVNLRHLVSKYLSAPSSTLASDYLSAGNEKIYTENLSKLVPQNAETLFFIKKNMNFIQTMCDPSPFQ